MSLKGDVPDLRVIDEWDGGVGWLAYPDEQMQRASHALLAGDDVWVVDPVDAPGVDDLLEGLGEVRGVVVGLDRHKRDAAALARRHDVSVYIPAWMTGVANKVDAPVERFADHLADSGYSTIRLRDSTLPPWQEVGLFDEETGTLVVPESVGTSEYYLARGERLGVHPMIRAVPPRRILCDLFPERVLVGHGEGVFEKAADALEDALYGSRRRMPALYAKTARLFLTR